LKWTRRSFARTVALRRSRIEEDAAMQTQATPQAKAAQPRPDQGFDEWLKRAIQQAFAAPRTEGPQRLAA